MSRERLHTPESSDSSSVDVRDIFRVLMRRKIMLVTPWLFAVGVGVAAAFLLPPIYHSNVTMLLERPQALSGPLGSMVGGGDPEQQAEIMRDQVQSTMFLRGVLQASGVLADPATRAWALQRAAKFPGTADEKVEGWFINHLRSAVTIKRAKGNVFQITVEDYFPGRARTFGAAIANEFLLSSKAAQLEAVRATQEFSIEQQQIYKRKLDESEQRLESFRRGALASQMGSSTVNEANQARARSLLEQADLDVSEQRDRVDNLKQQFGTAVQDNDPAQLSSAQANSIIGQLTSLERQLAQSLLLSDAGTNDNSGATRQAIARKVAELEQQFNQDAAIALPNVAPETRDLLVRYRLAQADLQAKQARRAYLSGQLSGFETRVVMTPDREMELQRLTAEVETNRQFYNSFLQQSAASQISEAFQNAKVSGRFVVLEPASLPNAPSKPNRLMLILLSFVVGGIVGVGSVLVVEQHDQSMRNAEEVESLLGLPVLGAIPRVEELHRNRRRSRAPASAARANATPATPDPGLLHRLKVESPLGLEFRRIYLKLAKTRGRTLPSTLLVTSSTRGEGKTTTTACLGITLARELGEKVLIVDFDLRSPALHRALGLPSSSWGLAQMLYQQKFDPRFVRTTVLPHLDFLPAGRSERPAAELLDTDAVEWFLKDARTRYPLVLIDSAPTLAVPDPLILGRAVEGVLYVIKAGTTVRKAAEYGVKVQREACDNILGVLMNDAGEVLPHYYGYHDAYGYSPEAAGGESS